MFIIFFECIDIIQFERLYFEDNLSFSMAMAVDVFCLLCLALNIALSMLLELVTSLRPVNDDTTRNIKLENKTICRLKIIHQSLNFDV